MNHIKNIWKCFEEKHSAIAKWLYQIFYFVIFSMGVTVFQYLVFTFLPGILGIGLAGTEFMWPKVSMNLFGVKFTWSLLGYNVLRDATGNILIPEFYYRLKVKAGLTGYAQVYGKYNTTPYDKLKLDLFYIENYSFFLDLKLLLMTVKIFFQKEVSEGVNDNQTNALKDSAESIDVTEDKSTEK